MDVAVIGAGIGGLTAALTLARVGLSVRVYEQAPALREVGAGIQLAPNATRILHRLGLAAALARVAVRPAQSELRRWDDGRTLWSQPLGDAIEARFGAPYYHLYRPDLLDVLAAALPAGVLRLGHRLVALRERAGGVDLGFADAAPARADVVVGADGIHSAVRAVLLGPESPRFSGSAAYRGLVPIDRLAHLDLPRQGYAWLGPDRHFVHYYVAAGRLMNFVGVCPAGEWRLESWSARGRVPDALAEFAGFHPVVREIIGAVDETYRWALYDRPPLARWSMGRITLLGDAAHAMLPFLAQGACQAIEDAAALAALLAGADAGAVPERLARYEALRKPRTTRVQQGSYENATTYHLPDGPAQQARDARYATLAQEAPYAARGWLFDYDAEVEAGR
ncbi:MAG TPA: FAD-dependent monooxygenase [Candidatus Nitrosotalea sp.]|nr:FAD-dependent monooxygenase [Candidatus Nitrosotalea sp.]